MKNLILDADQEKVLTTFMQHRLLLVTGGPGTGKSTVIKQVCDLLDSKRRSFVLCAPTGKAAKRVQELSGRSACTIHRLLGAGYGWWQYHESNKLPAYDWLICDESSMLDIELAWRLLQALEIKTNLIFVGDKDQLPPVGPGAFFRDLLQSRLVPTITLQTNHRTGVGSLIADNALLINKGGTKLTFSDDDFVFDNAENPIIVRERIIPWLEKLKALGYDPVADIQFISPQKQTTIGVEEVNKLIRFHLNRRADLKDFAPGDKVMCTSNDYKLDVFNGYIGVIEGVYRSHYAINFYDKGLVSFPRSRRESLIYAYCCTVHKMQGSEARAGVFICSSTHTYMLSRNLLYTAITRFKERCVILGDIIALAKSCRDTKADDRFSKLQDRLLGIL